MQNPFDCLCRSVLLAVLCAAGCTGPRDEARDQFQTQIVEPALTMRKDVSGEEPKKVIRYVYQYYLENSRWPTNRSELNALASKDGGLDSLASYKDILFTPDTNGACNVVFVRRGYKMSTLLPKP